MNIHMAKKWSENGRTKVIYKETFVSNQSLLDVKANRPDTSPFFVCPNGFGEHLFSNVYSTWDV